MSGKMKILGTLFMLIALVLSSAVSAIEFETRGTQEDLPPANDVDLLNTGSLPGVDVMFVKVNGDEVENGRSIREKVDRGQTLDVRVKLEANENVNNLKVMAWIAGDEHYALSEQSETLDMTAGDRETVDFELQLPEIVDQDTYQLRIIVASRDGATLSYNYPLGVDAKKHSFRIKDAVVYPSQVSPGRTFNTIVRLENLGEKKEEGIKVSVSVPELPGAYNADYIDEVKSDDETTSEEIYVKIPSDAQPGVYDVVIEVEYDEYTKSITATKKIQVVGDAKKAPSEEDGAAEKGKTIVTIGPEAQDVVAGEGGAIYPLTLANEGSTPKTYTVGVSGADGFADVMIKPSNVVTVEPGESESVYVYVAAKENAQAGSHGFTVDIKSGEKVLRQIPLTANVVKGEKGWDGLKKGLEIGLIVLIIVLIVLGLIVAFTRAKGSDEEEEASGQTYY